MDRIRAELVLSVGLFSTAYLTSELGWAICTFGITLYIALQGMLLEVFHSKKLCNIFSVVIAAIGIAIILEKYGIHVGSLLLLAFLLILLFLVKRKYENASA